MSELLEKVEATIRRHGLLADGDSVALAVSGGPDSLCLLHAMYLLARDRFSGISLHVGHLHHGMRGAAGDADAAFVAEQAAALGIGCTVERADVPALAVAAGVGEEAAGREARYGFLARLAVSLGARRIATGHNADDQAETVLMRCMRGAGPHGLAGIPYHRSAPDAPGVRIIRPLLDCTRDEIAGFLRERGLSGRLDSTNLSPRYLRNRVRMDILPRLEAEFGGDLRRRLLRLAEMARAIQRNAKDILKELYPRLAAQREDGAVEADAAALAALGPAAQAETVAKLLRETGGDLPMLTSRHYVAIRLALFAGTGSVVLPGGRRLLVSAGRLRLEAVAAPTETGSAGTALNIPGITPLPAAGGHITAEILETGDPRKAKTGDPFEARMDLERVSGKLRARFPRPGDRMRPLGAPGRRKLQDILTDLRVPRWRRRTISVVTLDERPIWIVGHRVAEEVRLTERTRRTLRLRFVRDRADQGAGGADAGAVSGPG